MQDQDNEESLFMKESEEYPERPQESVVKRDNSNKRVLIVEDSLTHAEELKDSLQEHGCWVTVATNGQEGLAAARKRKPDLIITDFFMPVMDGYEMCQAMKQDETLKDIPIMLLTVPSNAEGVIRALEAGVDYYLTKPCYESFLLSRVESALAKPVRRNSEGEKERLEIAFGDERHIITSDRQQMLSLLLSTHDNAIQQNRELVKVQHELQKISEQLQQEIAERQQAEEKIRKLKDFSEGIVQNLIEGIAVEDAEGYIIFVNPAAANLLGHSPQELLGQHWTAIVPPNQHPSVQAACKRHIHGEADRYELQLVRKDGTLVPVLVSSTPRIEEGRFAGTLTVFTDITKHKQVEKELQQSLDRLRRTFYETVNALASAIKTRNPFTAGHQQRVTQLACAIAEEMGLPKEQIEGIRVAGTLHDIGQINVPIEILSNPDQLSEFEYGIIQAHPQIGYDILKTVEFPWPVADIVLQHHERLDGSGYPQGLSGEEILLEARIVAVAEVVEAMASRQPYRSAIGIYEALEEIAQNRGILYDSGAVGACLKLFRERGFKFKQEAKIHDQLGWPTDYEGRTS
jgi:PAS domain S-box-containing protein/putative nucleotidyltransferase with HDIG domain